MVTIHTATVGREATTIRLSGRWLDRARFGDLFGSRPEHRAPNARPTTRVPKPHRAASPIAGTVTPFGT
jgi:hypothetical protein